MEIETANLVLILCEAEILKEAIQGNEALGRKLSVTVLDNRTAFGVGALQYSLNKLSESEAEPQNARRNLLVSSPHAPAEHMNFFTDKQQ